MIYTRHVFFSSKFLEFFTDITGAMEEKYSIKTSRNNVYHSPDKTILDYTLDSASSFANTVANMDNENWPCVPHTCREWASLDYLRDKGSRVGKHK